MTSQNLKDFYRGKRVLVTGHTGFKGSWLCAILREWGACVAGVSLPPPTRLNAFTELEIEKDIAHHVHDVRDGGALIKVFSEMSPEIVFHLAAQPLVRESYDDPVTTISTNVMGTVNVMEAARGCPSVRSLVIITTDKVYENHEWVYPYRECDALGGHDPYSASKAAADILAQSYSRSFFPACAYGQGHSVLVAIARAGNVIGGGDWAKDRLVPDAIRAVFEGDPLCGPVLSLRNPGAVRPWEHVLEPLSGYLMLGKSLFEGKAEHAGAWNFGPSTDSWISVGGIVDRIFKLSGCGTSRCEPDETKHEAGLLMLDTTKAAVLLGWKPRWEVNRALEETVRWYCAFYQRSDNVRQLTVRQINEFFS
jgi:CDP-glucose 4,6-dehydratase